MESYGLILRTAREEKQLEFETVAKETSITKEYLEALEAEMSSVFPGEPYFVGFLKNYAEYLGIDAERILRLYHNKKLQETPPPVELTAHEPPKFLFPLIGVIIGILLILGIIFGVRFVVKKIAASKENVSVSKVYEVREYELGEKPFSGRLYKSDQLVVGGGENRIVLNVSDTAGKFVIETPVGKEIVELSEEREIDINGDANAELIIYVSDVSQKDNDRGAEVRIMLKNSANAKYAASDDKEIPKTEDLPRNQKRMEILSDNRAYPFTVNASFRAGCLFRYKADRKEIIEDYLGKEDLVTTTASNGIRFWISNGNAVKLQVIANAKTYDLGVSKAGEVISQDIRWIKDTDGKYKLVVIELD